MEGVTRDGLLRHPDGSLWQFMPKVNRQPFRCKCGCNVFHKMESDENVFICNACETSYQSE